jgi:uridine kinase
VGYSEFVENLVMRIVSEPASTAGAKVVAICGWAGTGKSTLAQSLCECLRSRGVSADHISTDSFLVERAVRKKIGVSGYNPVATDLVALQSAFASIINGVEFEYRPYDSKAGKQCGPKRKFGTPDVSIIEGVRAFDACILPWVSLAIALRASSDVMKSLRIAANLRKCGLDLHEATRWLDIELREFDEFIAPTFSRADIVADVDSRYSYAALA